MMGEQEQRPGGQRAIHVGDATLYRNAAAAWGDPGDVLSLPSGHVVHLDLVDAEFLTLIFEVAQADEARAHMVPEPTPSPVDAGTPEGGRGAKPNDRCVCGHPEFMHSDSGCLSDDPPCWCSEFARPAPSAQEGSDQ